MDSCNFELNSRAIADVAKVFGSDFAFEVGGVDYKCSRVQACFVSGLVRRLLASDCCLSRVRLKVNDNKRQFKSIVILMNGNNVSVTAENARFLEECARELENDDLLGCVLDFRLDRGEMTWKAVVERIRAKHESHRSCKSELDFVALYFFRAELEALANLSLSELELVLTNPLLKLESEDQLYDTILALVDRHNSDEYLVLLRYVQFVFLTEEKQNEFLDRIFPDLVDDSIWKMLCECVRRVSRSKEKKSLEVAERYAFDLSNVDHAFKGIFDRLSDECDGNPHTKDEIAITASSTNKSDCFHLVDSEWNSWWESKRESNSFVQFDFKSRRVCLSKYSLKSDGGNGHLLSWVIEVSNDGSTWEIVDDRYTQDLNGASIVKTYSCNKRTDRFVRFVRLRQTSRNSGYGLSLCLSRIEFFGILTN